MFAFITHNLTFFAIIPDSIAKFNINKITHNKKPALNMKIGILDADPLSPAIIRRYGCYTDKFIELLSPLQQSYKNSVSFNSYNVFDMQYPETIDECDCYIITGSQYSTYDDIEWIQQLQHFIVRLHDHRKKLIGICFGHQLIAQALGGRVEKNPKGWEIGITATHITEAFSWMQPQRDFIFSLVSHQDHVTRLPENAVNFAETNLSPYSGFCVDQHILTFQGHPEFSKNYVRLIIKLESKNLAKEQRKSARASLLQSDDHELQRDWIINFIQS